MLFSAEIREEVLDPKLRHRVARDNHRLREFLAGPMLKKGFGDLVGNWEDYLRLFSNAGNESAIGEASVLYLWSRTAPEGIAEKISDAKILVMLRDPAERAFSQYLQGVSAGFIGWSFREHIEFSLRHNSEQISLYHPFLELGLYSEQLARYLERLGSNIWIGFNEDFRTRPIEVFQSICQFLGVDHEFSPQMTRRYLEPQVPRLPGVGWLKRSGMWEAVAKLTPSGLRPLIRRTLIRRPGTARMYPADGRYLVEFYSEDIRKLASLLGRNLDSWLCHG
jgi:hypothetical protein